MSIQLTLINLARDMAGNEWNSPRGTNKSRSIDINRRLVEVSTCRSIGRGRLVSNEKRVRFRASGPLTLRLRSQTLLHAQVCRNQELLNAVSLAIEHCPLADSLHDPGNSLAFLII